MKFYLQTGHEEVIDVLISKNADVDRPDYTGRTPLHVAVLWSIYMPESTLLVGYNERCLTFTDRISIARKLIHAGADINACDMFNRTPIWHTANLNSETGKKRSISIPSRVLSFVVFFIVSFIFSTDPSEMIKLLMDSNANAFIEDKHGMMPLFLAVKHGDTKDVLHKYEESTSLLTK